MAFLRHLQRAQQPLVEQEAVVKLMFFSTRIHLLLGIDEETARERFGFLIDAFAYGAPPHGGIAFGLDRMVMLLTGEDSIRDVIPFPKTQKGTDLMTAAPGDVDERQLREVQR